MSENILSATDRILREIQSELADMRDDRAVIVAILNRLDAGQGSYNAELRALRSQLNRFRNETRETLLTLTNALATLMNAVTRIEQRLTREG